MHKYNYFFVFLTCVVIGSILYGFRLAGSPLDKKNIKEDTERLSNMSNVKYAIENYSKQYQSLPESLDEISKKMAVTLPVDPKTEQSFEYKITGTNSYSLCAVFATDTKNPSSPNYKSPPDTVYLENTTLRHSKGYDCIAYKLNSSIVKPQASPTPRSSSPMVFYGTIGSIADTETGTRIIINENNSVRIVNASNSALLNKQGDKVNVSYFRLNDKVIVDAVLDYSSYPASRYTAIQIQNLDR